MAEAGASAPPAGHVEYPLLSADSDSSDNDDFGSKSYRPNNRGNKLKRRALEPDHALPHARPVLWANRVDENMQYFALDKKRRAIISKRSRYTDDYKPSPDDPYAGINVEEIWALPDRPEDVKRHAPTVRTLRSRQLRIICDDAMTMIESEKELAKQLTRLTDVLQQDDPSYQDVDFERDGIQPELVKDALDSAQEYLNCVNEYINQIETVRQGLITTYNKKRELAKELVPFNPPANAGGQRKNVQ
ncbi:hypothetical protein DFJ74DRAFT_696655 [Hyaloraphidium curvatum]|nr:hypothetical protein DFJ74DRAFT_696655 [Hyaloraphidium curvatum]